MSGEIGEPETGRPQPGDDSWLHDMGGDIGPASIRGSDTPIGGHGSGDAAPTSGFSEPTDYMAGRDGDWTVAGEGFEEQPVDPQAGGRDEEDTFGPGMPAAPADAGGHPVEPGHPGFRVRGPVDEAHAGEIDDPDPAPDDPDADTGVTAARNRNGGHVTAGLDWDDGDSGDPDGGSGRTWA
jgi:hypothetical protein